MGSSGNNNITRPALLMTLLVLILLSSSSGAEADDENCGVLISDAPMCEAPNADACETWCYHKGYSTGACYAGVNRRACICENPCSSKEAQGQQRLPSSVAEPTNY